MPKRRRKLSPEMEKEISLIFKEVELITALIFDISDEELQGEYIQGFEEVKAAAINLKVEYDTTGFNENSESYLAIYKTLLSRFKEDYEL